VQTGCRERLVKGGPITPLATLDLDELGEDGPVAAVQVGGDRRALRLDAKPAPALLV
jgi:hypothetical protein